MYPSSAAHAKQTLVIKGRLGKKVLEFKDNSGKVVDRLKGDQVRDCRTNNYLVCYGKIKKKKDYRPMIDEYGVEESGCYISRTLECRKLGLISGLKSNG